MPLLWIKVINKSCEPKALFSLAMQAKVPPQAQQLIFHCENGLVTSIYTRASIRIRIFLFLVLMLVLVNIHFLLVYLPHVHLYLTVLVLVSLHIVRTRLKQLSILMNHFSKWSNLRLWSKFEILIIWGSHL